MVCQYSYTEFRIHMMWQWNKMICVTQNVSNIILYTRLIYMNHLVLIIHKFIEHYKNFTIKNWYGLSVFIYKNQISHDVTMKQDNLCHPKWLKYQSIHQLHISEPFSVHNPWIYWELQDFLLEKLIWCVSIHVQNTNFTWCDNEKRWFVSSKVLQISFPKSVDDRQIILRAHYMNFLNITRISFGKFDMVCQYSYTKYRFHMMWWWRRMIFVTQSVSNIFPFISWW